jgi:ligand-binding sensor domain-containing protein
LKSIRLGKSGPVHGEAGFRGLTGKRWHSYTTTDGLPGNHVFSLHTDLNGRLWIGTNSGLTWWDNGRFGKALTIADGLFANNVFAMTSSADGALWVGSYGGVAHLRKAK